MPPGKDVIDDGVNNGSGSPRPIDIINDHLPELQWLRSIMRNADVVGRLFSSSLRLSSALPSAARVVVSSFELSPPPDAFRRRHRLRVIPAWAEIFFYPPSWRFAKIHSSRVSEGARERRRKNPLAGGEKSRSEKASRSESRWRAVVIVVARMRLVVLGMIICAAWRIHRKWLHTDKASSITRTSSRS